MATDRKSPTRAYLSDDRTHIILRTDGNDVAVPLVDDDGEPRVPQARQALLALEMTAILLLRGCPMAVIVCGDCLPDRSLPLPKDKAATVRALSRIAQALANVRARELQRVPGGDGKKPSKADAQAAAEAWVRKQPKEIIADLAELEAVKIEAAHLSGGVKMTVEDALAKSRARIGDGKPASEEEVEDRPL